MLGVDYVLKNGSYIEHNLKQFFRLLCYVKGIKDKIRIWLLIVIFKFTLNCDFYGPGSVWTFIYEAKMQWNNWQFKILYILGS